MIFGNSVVFFVIFGNPVVFFGIFGNPLLVLVIFGNPKMVFGDIWNLLDAFFGDIWPRFSCNVIHSSCLDEPIIYGRGRHKARSRMYHPTLALL